MKLGYIGLGKMGENMVLRLLEQKHDVVVYNRSKEAGLRLEKHGAKPSISLVDMIQKLETPRTIWLMVPHVATTSLVNELASILEQGDVVIDGGNTLFSNTIQHAKIFETVGVTLLDAGVSGGPHGARHGACIMVGGQKNTYELYEHLFSDLSVPNGYAYVGVSGAGHFVKMVHNGIEYGMMQSIAEGFNLLHTSAYNLDVQSISSLYNHGSVIESHLIAWLQQAYIKNGKDLIDISGSVDQNGEGEWTSVYADSVTEQTPSIDLAVQFRKNSKENPSYIGKVLSAMRREFGGHDVSLK